jgi:hypothetical protein
LSERSFPLLHGILPSSFSFIFFEKT